MRNQYLVTIKDRGRPLTFTIQEMPASQMENWLSKVVTMLAGPDKTVPGGAANLLNAARLLCLDPLRLANMDYARLKPLMDELLTCCRLVVDNRPDATHPVTPDNVDSFIEDWRTLFHLRREALKCSLGFHSAAGPSNCLPWPAATSELRQ